MSFLWTKSKARLKFLYNKAGKNINWIFIPGGPGLGSESLKGLPEMLHLPGNVWLMDFPGDGSNTVEDNAEAFSHWQQALIETANALPNVVMAAHSSGGMFVLATPELEKNIAGLVLMDSAPNASWQYHFMQYVTENPLPEVHKWQEIYNVSPSNEILKKLTIASAPYFSTNKSLQSLRALCEGLPFNYQTHGWADKHFDQTYQAKWIPQHLPTLIFAGEHDHITPISLFTEMEAFDRENILIRTIGEGSHFPWQDQPEQVKKIFEELCKMMSE